MEKSKYSGEANIHEQQQQQQKEKKSKNEMRSVSCYILEFFLFCDFLWLCKRLKTIKWQWLQHKTHEQINISNLQHQLTFTQTYTFTHYWNGKCNAQVVTTRIISHYLKCPPTITSTLIRSWSNKIWMMCLYFVCL